MILVEEGKLRSRIPSSGTCRNSRPAAATGTRSRRAPVDASAGLVPTTRSSSIPGTPEEIFARKNALPLAVPARLAVSSTRTPATRCSGELVRQVSGPRASTVCRGSHLPSPGHEGHALSSRSRRGVPRIADRPDGEARATLDARRGPRSARLRAGRRRGPRRRSSRRRTDLAKLCQMILDGGRLGKVRILSPLGVEAMTRPRFYGDSDVRGLGLDIATATRETAASSSRSAPSATPGSPARASGSIPPRDVPRFPLQPCPSRRQGGRRQAARPRGDDRGGRRRRGRSPAARALAAGFPGRAGDLRGHRRARGGRLPRHRGQADRPRDQRDRRARDGRSTTEVLTSAEAKKAGVSWRGLFSPEHGFGPTRMRPSPTASTRSRGLPFGRSMARRGGRVRRSCRSLRGRLRSCRTSGPASTRT